MRAAPDPGGGMTLSYQEQKYLQRLVVDRPSRRNTGAVAKGLSAKYGLGHPSGNVIFYMPNHWDQAERLLHSHELPVQALGAAATRAAAAQYGGMSEKSGTRAVHNGEVAIKLLGACTWRGQPIVLPPQMCIVVKVQELHAIDCDVLCLVENWEAFTDLHRYAWLVLGQRRVMAVFRGDNLYSPAHVKSVLEARVEPLWAFVDFDPAGLGIAEGLPGSRIEKVVLPPWDWLKQASCNPIGRGLYDAQVGQWSRVLDAAASPVVREAWGYLRTWGFGMTQERMLTYASNP